ncbi:hypothetical protein ACCT20_37320, partial [Rhizobium ruizarguesonis]
SVMMARRPATTKRLRFRKERSEVPKSNSVTEAAAFDGIAIKNGDLCSDFAEENALPSRHPGPLLSESSMTIKEEIKWFKTNFASDIVPAL